MSEERYINIFLYHLIDIENLSPNFDNDFLLSLKSDYSAEDRNNIIKALYWAVKNPSLDFQSMLPGICFTNDEIFKLILSIVNKIEE